MSDPDQKMPADFGLRFVLWTAWRWLYFNPLTLLFIAQGELVDLAMDNPAWKWAARGASFVGIVIAQVRNRGKDYTVPILPVKPPETPKP